LTGSAIWSGHHAARIQSTFAIPAARYLCDLSLRTDDLDLVGRPDKHVIGRAMAAMAALEAEYKAAIELFAAGERILLAFARLLIVLVRTLPSIVFAGLIALGGVWLINYLDNNLIQLPVASNQLSTAPASSNHSPSNEQSSENR